ncbi:MAG: type IV toxin-antitoxin system AbiEi family antitoxin [Bacteroidales bacterium]|nr:type IV toxin-antitoxin system AbiEi family antitoxin [Bacteroidales bacterium]
MGKKEQNKWNSFFLNLRERGRCTFTFDDVRKHFNNLSEQSLSQELYRYSVKKQIVKIRKGFYGILTPETAIGGMLPPDLFVDALMKSLHKPYYVAMLSAAALHGSAHQQPMEYFVVAQTPAPRSIRNNRLKITFTSKKTWEQSAVEQKKTRAGYLNVSSTELTAFDLLENIHTFGINRITTVLEELYEEMTPSRLSKIAKLIDNKANIQRLGYILDTVINDEKLANSLYEILNKTSFSPVPLSPQKGKKGQIDNKWKIIVNMQIESDL